MEGKKSMNMSFINGKDDQNGASSDGETKGDNERSLLIASNNSEKNNLSSTSASYRSLLSISEDGKEYPSTEEIDRSLYLDNTTTWLSSLMHVIKGNIGIGALSLPFAMMNSGIVVGPILLVVIATATIRCMHLLVQCSHTLCDRTKSLSLGYAQIAEMSIALYRPNARHIGRIVVNVFLIFTQLGFCCVYFIFVSQNLEQALHDHVQLDVRVWIVILLLPVILLSYIRTLKVLTVVSLISNVLYGVGVLCILIYAGETMKSPETLPKFVGFGSVPITFGVIVFSLEGIGVIMPVENMMALPRNFSSVVSVGMTVVVLIYLLLGVLGFASCGMHCLGSFTLNLPNTPYYSAVKGIFAMAIFLTYFLQFYVPMSLITPTIQEKIDEKYRTLVDCGIRTLIVCLTAVLAIAVPQLGDMISLVGSIGSTSLAIIFPPVIHILTFSYDNSLSTTSLVVNILLVICGFIGAVFGMYTSLIDIISNFQHPATARGASLSGNISHASL